MRPPAATARRCGGLTEKALLAAAVTNHFCPSYQPFLSTLPPCSRLWRYYVTPPPNPRPRGGGLVGASASKRDVTPAPHFITSLAVLAVFWMKTASDVTLEPISVTSLNNNGIKCYSIHQIWSPFGRIFNPQ